MKWFEDQLDAHPFLTIVILAGIAVPFFVGLGITSPMFKAGQAVRNKIAPASKQQPASGRVSLPGAGTTGIRGHQPQAAN